MYTQHICQECSCIFLRVPHSTTRNQCPDAFLREIRQSLLVMQPHNNANTSLKSGTLQSYCFAQHISDRATQNAVLCCQSKNTFTLQLCSRICQEGPYSKAFFVEQQSHTYLQGIPHHTKCTQTLGQRQEFATPLILSPKKTLCTSADLSNQTPRAGQLTTNAGCGQPQILTPKMQAREEDPARDARWPLSQEGVGL